MMVTVEVSVKLTMDDLLAAVDKLPNQALLEFCQRLLALQTKRGLSLVDDKNEQALVNTATVGKGESDV